MKEVTAPDSSSRSRADLQGYTWFNREDTWMEKSASQFVESVIEQSNGLTKSELAVAFENAGFPGKPNDELGQGIEGRRIRFVCELEALSQETDSYGRTLPRRGVVRFHSMSRFPLEAPKDEVVDRIIGFLDSKDDGARMASPSAFAVDLFDAMNRRHGYSADEITSALYGLLDEAVVHVRHYDGADSLLFTLVSAYQHTVFAYDAASQERYCFYVRAGTPKVAVQKIRSNGAYQLCEIIGMCPGYIKATGEPGSEGRLTRVVL
jgi:hypothetical protein